LLLLLLLAAIPKSHGAAECGPALTGNNVHDNNNTTTTTAQPVESKGLAVFVNTDYIQTIQSNDVFLASMPHEISLVVMDGSESTGTTIQEVWMRFHTTISSSSNTSNTIPNSDRLFGVAPGRNTIMLSECEDKSTSVLISNRSSIVSNDTDTTVNDGDLTTGDRFSGYLLMTQPGQLSLQVTVVFQSEEDNAQSSSSNDIIIVSSTYELSFVGPTSSTTQNNTFGPTMAPSSSVPTDLISSILDGGDNTTSTTSSSSSSSSAPPPSTPVEANDTNNNSNSTTIPPTTDIQVDSTPIDQMVENLRLDLRISFNGEFDADQWEDLTQQWFEAFYENYNYSSSDNTTDMDSEIDAAWGIQDMTTEIHLVRIESQNPLVILYDQRLLFTQLNTEDALPVLQYTTLPFRSKSGNAAYADILQTELLSQSALPRPIAVPQILGPAADTQSSSSNSMSKGGVVAIVLVVIAIVLGVVVLGYFRYQSYQKSVDGPAFNMSTFSFGHHISSGNESPLTNDEER
jgi:hypothetical protein